MMSTAAKLSMERWLLEVTKIMVSEHGMLASEAKQYARSLWPTEDDLERDWNGKMPTARDAVEADKDNW